MPVAEKVAVCPTLNVELSEVLALIIMVATGPTVTVSAIALLVMPEEEAVIWVDPRVRAVTKPPETEATLVTDEAHVAELTDTAFPN